MVLIMISFVRLILLSLAVSTKVESTIILSNYSSELTVYSGTYTRDEATGDKYYYEAIEIRVNTTGVYTFQSSSSIGDTYGYMYQGNFYPSYPSYNIVSKDDDSAGNDQFKLTVTLRSDIKYILVFTTYNQHDTGSFSILASGPDNVFNPIKATNGTTILIEAGPIWNDDDAQTKCPKLCQQNGMQWNNSWMTTKPMVMSVCQCFL